MAQLLVISALSFLNRCEQSMAKLIDNLQVEKRTVPIFTPNFNEFPYVNVIDIEFWHPGFAKSQMHASLHAAEEQNIAPILEISGKSKSPLGVSLSAFNLPLEPPNGRT